mmetsp:Transcript_28315/g.57883  ORF Transcript_28315/g.57883 Transcript_28315/m.57883 type:complete len:221 (+) Transcript_28315:547-1209(+)
MLINDAKYALIIANSVMGFNDARTMYGIIFVNDVDFFLGLVFVIVAETAAFVAARFFVADFFAALAVDSDSFFGTTFTGLGFAATSSSSSSLSSSYASSESYASKSESYPSSTAVAPPRRTERTASSPPALPPVLPTNAAAAADEALRDSAPSASSSRQSRAAATGVVVPPAVVDLIASALSLPSTFFGVSRTPGPLRRIEFARAGSRRFVVGRAVAVRS